MALWKKLLIVAAALVALFAVLGFFVAPPLVKARLLREMSKRLNREVSVGAVSVNPFELALTVRDLKILDKDGKPFASWDKGFFNYRFTSLLSHDFVFDELAFDNPYARFVINKDGTLNIEDLLQIFRASPSDKSAGPPSAWRFQSVRVTGARIGFTDRQRTPEFESTVGPFELHLDRFSTSPNSESPYGFQGKTESGETFAWTGRITSNPLKSSGELTLGGIRLPKYHPYYETGRPFHVSDGTISVHGSYDIVWTDTQHVMKVHGASLTLENAAISRPGVETPDITVKSLKVDGADVDLVNIAAKIDSIVLDGGRILLSHDPKAGGVNLHQMLRPFLEGPPPAGAATAGSTAPPSAAASSGPPPISIGLLSVKGVDVDAQDLEPSRPFKVTAHDVALEVKGFKTEPATMCPASLSARIGDSGTVKATGSFGSDFHAGGLDVEVNDVDVRPTDVYLDPYAHARIASGSLGARGHVDFQLPDQGSMAFDYQGDLRLKDFALVHADTANEIVRCAVFQLSPLHAHLNPMSIAIGEVAIGAPQLRAVVEADRTIDLTKVLVSSGDAGSSPPPASAAPPSTNQSLPHTTIDTLRVQNGSFRVTDKSVEPNVLLELTRFSGTIKGISTDELSKANVDLTALLDNVAPVAIKGQINPIARKDFTDLTMTAKGIDLLPFSPYSGKYIGYGIDKGKLAADLSYKISQRRFTSNNVFTIDQFELGSQVESPDAVHLPVKLAVAVLRDKNGQIVLDVPAEGSVDDPDFRLGKVIVRAIVNVLTKIVTSPFRLLAGAFGGGKDQSIEFQEFAPGSAELPASEKAKLDIVAKSLAERPALSLDIEAATDPAADGAALGKARLASMVRAAKWRVVSRNDPSLAAPESVTVGPDEYPKWLRSAYDAAFPAPAAPAAPAPKKGEPPPPAPPPPSVEEMESKLAGTISVSADDLRALAAERGKAVRDYLTQSGQVPAERVFLSEAGSGTKRDPAPRVWLELK